MGVRQAAPQPRMGNRKWEINKAQCILQTRLQEDGHRVMHKCDLARSCGLWCQHHRAYGTSTRMYTVPSAPGVLPFAGESPRPRPKPRRVKSSGGALEDGVSVSRGRNRRRGIKARGTLSKRVLSGKTVPEGEVRWAPPAGPPGGRNFV